MRADRFTVTVNPNPPPAGGTFNITPNTGVHQGDALTLTAAGWTDPDRISGFVCAIARAVGKTGNSLDDVRIPVMADRHSI